MTRFTTADLLQIAKEISLDLTNKGLTLLEQQMVLTIATNTTIQVETLEIMKLIKAEDKR